MVESRSVRGDERTSHLEISNHAGLQVVDVLVHQSMYPVMIRCSDRFGYRRVLFRALDQTFEATRSRHPKPLEAAPLLFGDVGEDGVARRLLEKLMELGVACRPKFEIRSRGGHRHSFDTLLEVRALLDCEVLGRSDEQSRIQETKDIADLNDVRRREPGHRVATVLVATHEVIEFEPLQSGSYRGTADTQPLGNCHLS